MAESKNRSKDSGKSSRDSYLEVMARIEAVLADPSMTVKGVRPRRRKPKDQTDSERTTDDS